MDGALVVAGALTGLVVGVTGVGGGALMTPVLLLVFDTTPLTAVGTDLWFAALTKLAVAGVHMRLGLIDWVIVRRLWTGSLPASALALIWMSRSSTIGDPGQVVRLAIGAAVCMTALGLLGSRWLQRPGQGSASWSPARVAPVTVVAGAALGLLVTLTSVGAGALGAVILVHVYAARLSPVRLVATDIAHAVPLAVCAGAGHLVMGQVDGALLGNLLVGSVPAALAGVAVASRVPQSLVRITLGLVLLAVGLMMLAGGR